MPVVCGRSLLIASLFELWTSANVAEAWAEFSETKLFTPKKALYLELMAQASRTIHFAYLPHPAMFI